MYSIGSPNGYFCCLGIIKLEEEDGNDALEDVEDQGEGEQPLDEVEAEGEPLEPDLAGLEGVVAVLEQVLAHGVVVVVEVLLVVDSVHPAVEQGPVQQMCEKIIILKGTWGDLKF